LALSLHAAHDELRTKLVPINKSYPLKRLQAALAEYFRSSRRRVFIEYVLLAGENDRPEDAEALIRFVKETSPLLHVNLIVWNPTSTPHKPTAPPSAKRFANLLKRGGVSTTSEKTRPGHRGGLRPARALRKEGMIPLRDTLAASLVPFFNYALILVNIVCFIFELQMPPRALEKFVLHYGIVPAVWTNAGLAYGSI